MQRDDQRLHPAIGCFLVALFVVAILNIASLFIASVVDGGNALNGKLENGKYYLGYRSEYTEVSEATWNRSRMHTFSVIVTTFVGLIAAVLIHFYSPISVTAKRFTEDKTNRLRATASCRQWIEPLGAEAAQFSADSTDANSVRPTI